MPRTSSCGSSRAATTRLPAAHLDSTSWLRLPVELLRVCLSRSPTRIAAPRRWHVDAEAVELVLAANLDFADGNVSAKSVPPLSVRGRLASAACTPTRVFSHLPEQSHRLLDRGAAPHHRAGCGPRPDAAGLCTASTRFLQGNAAVRDRDGYRRFLARDRSQLLSTWLPLLRLRAGTTVGGSRRHEHGLRHGLRAAELRGEALDAVLRARRTGTRPRRAGRTTSCLTIAASTCFVGSGLGHGCCVAPSLGSERANGGPRAGPLRAPVA